MSLLRYFMQDAPVNGDTNAAPPKGADAHITEPDVTSVYATLHYMLEKKIPLYLEQQAFYPYQETFGIVSVDPSSGTYTVMSQQAPLQAHAMEPGQDLALSAKKNGMQLVFYGTILARQGSAVNGYRYTLRFPVGFSCHNVRVEKRIVVQTINPLILLQNDSHPPIRSRLINVSSNGFAVILNNREDKPRFSRSQRWCAEWTLPFPQEEVQLLSDVLICHISPAANGFDCELGCQIVRMDERAREWLCKFIQWQQV